MWSHPINISISPCMWNTSTQRFSCMVKRATPFSLLFSFLIDNDNTCKNKMPKVAQPSYTRQVWNWKRKSSTKTDNTDSKPTIEPEISGFHSHFCSPYVWFYRNDKLCLNWKYRSSHPASYSHSSMLLKCTIKCARRPKNTDLMFSQISSIKVVTIKPGRSVGGFVTPNS